MSDPVSTCALINKNRPLENITVAWINVKQLKTTTVHVVYELVSLSDQKFMTLQPQIHLNYLPWIKLDFKF